MFIQLTNQKVCFLAKSPIVEFIRDFLDPTNETAPSSENAEVQNTPKIIKKGIRTSDNQHW